MVSELNRPAWEKLIDEDIEWVLNQPRTLERDHILDCLKWLKRNRPLGEEAGVRETKKPPPTKLIEDGRAHSGGGE